MSVMGQVPHSSTSHHGGRSCDDAYVASSARSRMINDNQIIGDVRGYVGEELCPEGLCP